MSTVSELPLAKAVVWGLVLHGLTVPSRNQLRETVNRFRTCKAKDLHPVLEALERSHGLELTDRELRWRPEPLHRATLNVVSENPTWLLGQLESLPSWEYDRRNRLAIYLNLPEMMHPEYGSSTFQSWLLPSWDEGFFASRHPAIQLRLLGHLRTGLWKHGVWSPGLEAALERLPGEMRVELAMAQGRLDEARARIDASAKRKGYDSVLQFLEGDAARAWERFARLIARRKSPLDCFVSVFARLAALRVSALDALTDPRLSVADSMPKLERFFAGLAAYLRGKGQQPEPPTTDGLPWCVCWAVRAALSTPPSARPGSEARLRESGLLGWADQLQEQPVAPWGSGVVRREPWEVWLEGLRTKAETIKTAAPPARRVKQQLRLVWKLGSASLTAHFEDESGALAEVPLSSLIEAPPDFLTAQDHRALARVERRHFGLVTLVEMGPAVRALIGHPHLLFEDRPVRLVEGRQRLRLERVDRGFRLRLEPRLRNASDWRCRLVPNTDPDGHPLPSPSRGSAVAEVCFASPHNDELAPLLDEGHVIPFEAEDALRAAVAPWLDHIEVGYGEGVRPLAEAAPTGALLARVVPLQLGMQVTWVWSLGEGLSLPAFRGPEREVLRWQGRALEVRRNFEAEREQLAAFRERSPNLPDEEGGYASTLEAGLDLVTLLLEAGVPIEWPEGKAWRIRPQASTRQLSVRVDSDGEWFSVRGQLRVDETLMLDLSRLLELSRDLPGRYVQLADGDFVELSERLRQHLSSLDELVHASKKGLQMSPLAVPALAGLELPLKADKAFEVARERFEQASSHCPDPPAALAADLRDYQLDGYRWLSQRARAGAGACLADDMGLGKTMQVLALMIELQAEGPHLVVCPVSVTSHWRDQAQRFAPTLRPLLYEGKDRARLLDDLSPGDLLICSYRVMLQDIEQLRAPLWNVALLDEAQMIKNPHAQTSEASFTLKARTRIATSGTPVENRAAELWSIFRFLNPGLLGSLPNFTRRFEGLNRASQRQLRRAVSPFLLRRTKAQVLTELPPRTEVSLMVDLSPAERALYEVERREATEAIESPGGTFRTLAFLTRLRQACCHPRLLLDQSDLGSAKLAAFFELFEDLRSGRHRCLVFSQFTRLLDLLEAELVRRSVAFQRLDGSTPVAERRRRVDAFQAGTGELFLISLKAGGTGLNLTAADYVVHLDPWWNPASEDQASDRVHRIGQTRPVTIYRLIARDTVEEKVVQLHGHKRELAQALLDGQDGAAPLGVDEIRALLT